LKDLRLGLRRQVDRLCVAATLDVEDSVVRPTVLVVADEQAIGIGGKGSFASARQAEKERRPAGLFVRRR
jgi:hypothetical protein